eukprot:TRINITY_DN64697_c0_g1_i1.p2 TRINITY_DN64697_c0_g1~~TRINITY_DN64697_c0_g1_i1.p2  ORF type:complete len:358 (-),score=65.08 TRINITY_DN64697_c0_g1_i1:120-1193(-)
MAFKGQRWTLANVLPIMFVLWVIGSVWSLYIGLHLMYLLQYWHPIPLGRPVALDEAMYNRGVWQTAISQGLSFMLFLCFFLAAATEPGSVPTDSEWMPGRRVGLNEDRTLLHRTSEVKHTGAPRWCKWCECYKPDRCHHCRVCRSCILRMDHHCPWIANCVGFNNHKYFLLLVFYSLASVMFICVTMVESLQRVLNDEATMSRRFLTVFCMTLAIMMCVLLTLFFSLHLCLMAKATTTIEFCEKAYKRNGANAHAQSIYDLGVYRNVCSVLGPNPLFWLVPWSHPEGEGLQFSTNRRSSFASSNTTMSEVKDAAEKHCLSQGFNSRTSSALCSEASKGQDSDTYAPPEVTGHKASKA